MNSTSCSHVGIPTFVIYSVYLCVAVLATGLNGLVLLGLAHLSHSSSSKRFLGIRRSANRGHPRFQLKKMRYSVSVRQPNRSHANDSEDNLSSIENGAGVVRTLNSSIPRSPSCPDRLLYLHASPRASFKQENSSYWLNQLNIGRRKLVRPSPQPKARLTTALSLVCSLIFADLINACLTAVDIIISFYQPVGSFAVIKHVVFQIKPIVPCTRLVISSLLYTCHNAALFSILGLMIDLYLGVVRSIHYREIPKRTLLKSIIAGWIASLLIGCNQIILPAFRPTNRTPRTLRRFLPPSEPCDISGEFNDGGFCYYHGSANIYRSGFLTGALLITCALAMVFMLACTLYSVRKEDFFRNGTMRATNSRRSASLPMIHRLNGVVFALHGHQNHGFVPRRSTRCARRRFLRSAFALLSLVTLYMAFYLPSLVLDAYSVVVRPLSGVAPPWTYDLLVNLPVFVGLCNPVIYCLRMQDVRIGLHNFKRRLMAPADKIFVRQQLQRHRGQTLMPDTLLKIKLTPKTPTINGLCAVLPLR